MDIVLVNSSGRPQLQQALQYYGPTTAMMGSDVAVGAILGQEHHAKADAWVDLQHRGKALGWQLQGTEAGEADAGVLVLEHALQPDHIWGWRRLQVSPLMLHLRALKAD